MQSTVSPSSLVRTSPVRRDNTEHNTRLATLRPTSSDVVSSSDSEDEPLLNPRRLRQPQQQQQSQPQPQLQPPLPEEDDHDWASQRDAEQGIADTLHELNAGINNYRTILRRRQREVVDRKRTRTDRIDKYLTVVGRYRADEQDKERGVTTTHSLAISRFHYSFHLSRP
ncbi:hypothetical protein BDB00DRAFT_791854 [Zychaea mexicana]|uniref:uncharacterized protein n=1 Tax=Zychaea mexicana TaxID=64656 RepID=UPI0022FF0724|nr:uncharacterized protein BDB00DRAFT_791854 [Zychaea mexicana]KAI9488510.1 hypothetical protein BDB00DRAFT_791854 [Zychaea mexicana]